MQSKEYMRPFYAYSIVVGESLFMIMNPMALASSCVDPFTSLASSQYYIHEAFNLPNVLFTCLSVLNKNCLRYVA